MSAGFMSAGQSSLKNNRSLRRTNRRLFLDKENKYPTNSNHDAVNEIFREALERENQMYMENKSKSDRVNNTIKRLAIVFILGILAFGIYQLIVLFSI